MKTGCSKCIQNCFIHIRNCRFSQPNIANSI